MCHRHIVHPAGVSPGTRGSYNVSQGAHLAGMAGVSPRNEGGATTRCRFSRRGSGAGVSPGTRGSYNDVPIR